MDKSAVKDLIFGGLHELMKNRKFYRYSSIEYYSQWTDEGKEALAEYMQVMSWKLKEAEEDDLNKRAKDMTINILKGESN
jgi:hypothetical protein